MTTASPITPGSLRAWLLATRPATLTAAAAPVLVGTAAACHENSLRIGPGLAALFGAFCLQIGSNFANDVFDFEKGSDTAERLGPTRAVQAGLITPHQMKCGMFAVFGLALLAGVYLTWASGLWVVVVGILSILSAILYTGGPYPLGYHGLGDVFVMLFFGIIAVNGTTYVHLGHLTTVSILASIALGALAVNILVVNNLRDRNTDIVSGKRTLAVRFGRKFALAEYAFMNALAYTLLAGIVGAGLAGQFALLPLITIPFALKNFGELRALEGKALNLTLVKTAKLVFFFGILLALGLGTEHAVFR